MALETEIDRPAKHLVYRHIEQSGRSLIGCQNLKRPRIDHQNCVSGRLEQQSVTGFGLPRSSVTFLDFLLRVQETLLHSGDGAQVAAHGEHPPVSAESDRGMGN